MYKLESILENEMQEDFVMQTDHTIPARKQELVLIS